VKFAVVGASGAVGGELVSQALDRGHEVVAIGRPSSRFELPAEVEIRRCELTDEAGLAAAFEGADAVFSALGLNLPGISPFGKAEVPDLLSRTTPVLIAAMKRAGVDTVVAISAGGVGDSASVMPGFTRFIVKITSLRRLYPELEAMEAAYRASGLRVVCVRPTTLTLEEATGAATVAKKLVGYATIPRADLAGFMLDTVVEGRFDTFGPVVTVTGAG
jgi:putative NADH-flavin reductase